MKIVVIGGHGFIGSRLVSVLRERGHEVVAASPHSGVNTLTGEGLAAVLDGARVVVDVTNSPSFEHSAAMTFFETSSRNLLEAEMVAGVQHHIALSIVGTDRLQDSGYFRGKLAQERLIKRSGVPYTILRSTQFFEFLGRIADSFSDGRTVRIPSALVQPILSDEVVAALAELALAPPKNGTIEMAGPERFGLDEVVRKVLGARKDPRALIADTRARYFGAELSDQSLVPGPDARIASTPIAAWLGLATAA